MANFQCTNCLSFLSRSEQDRKAKVLLCPVLHALKLRISVKFNLDSKS